MSEETNENDIPTPNQTVNTDGGAYIDGSVNTSGGSFVGRDLTISETDEETIGLEELEDRPYIIKVTEEGSVFGDVLTAGGHFIGRDLIINNLEVKKIENKPSKSCESPCIPPYQGLFSFDKGDWDRFFGRDVLTAEIVSRLHDTNFLTVVGPSGSGKSSVVRAGVVPAILGWKELVNDVEPLPANWKDIIITPTSRPLSKIAETLFPNDETAQDQLQKQMQESGTALANALNKIASTDSHHRLLVIDQFEELFTLCDEDEICEAFIANLLYIAKNHQPHLKIILALRADFYHRYLENEKLAQLMPPENQVNVTPMKAEELAEAILRPAADGHWKLQVSLVDQMLDDVGQEPGALPLLSHALLETWNNRGWDVMTLFGYRKAGGVKGAIAHTANKTLENLSESEQLIAKRLFLRLTELGQETLDTRRKATFATIEEDAAARHVRQQLEKARLVVSDEDGVEIAHEALIREWPLLKEWLNTDREGLITHQRLGDAAERWQEKGEDRSYLLSGLRLTEAEEWAKTHDDDLNALERIFLEASLLAEKRRKRNRRFAQIGTAVVLTILVMLGIGTILINGERNNAVTARETAVAAKATSDVSAALAATSEAEAQVAEAQIAELKNSIQASQLASASEARLEQDPELTLLLATTGLGINNQPDTQARFYDAIFTPYRGTLYGHTFWVNTAVFHPNGDMILTASDDNTAKLWDLQGNELVSFDGHTDRVNTAIFSPDGNTVLTASVDDTAKLWDLQGNELASIDGHIGEVSMAVFSPDSDTVLTASSDGTVKLWDMAGNELASIDGHASLVRTAVFSPDGDTVLTASWDDTAKLWDLEGNEIVSFDGHTDKVNTAVFSPDGDMILTASWDDTAKLWDLQGNELASFDGHTDKVNTAVFSPDGDMILTASNDNTAKLWDLQGNNLASLDGHTGDLRTAVFSPDGDKVLTASDDDTAKLWDFGGYELASLDGHTGRVMTVVFSPDGDMILTASWDNTARLWDSKLELASLEGHTDEVYTAVFSPDGNTVLTASRDDTAKLWNMDGAELVSFNGHINDVYTAISHPGGAMVLTTSNDGTARLWDMAGNELASLDGHRSGVITSGVFSSDGDMILTASWDDTAKLWDLVGNELASFDGHTDRVNMAVFSPDGNMVLTASDDNTAKLWDLQGNELASLNGHTNVVNTAVFSPDGNMILTASDDDTAKLWDLQGNELASLNGHTNVVNTAVFHPDSDMILTASDDSTAKLWDLQGNELASLDGHTIMVNTAVFNSDGDMILTASDDGTAKLWDLQGNELASLDGHTDDVNSAVFNPNGDMILTASRDDTAKLWHIYPTIQSKVAVAQERLWRGFTDAECIRFFPDDRDSCPQTVEAVFALFEDDLADE